MRKPRNTNPASVFKPYIVKRSSRRGGCQVLFPLTELDRLVGEVCAGYDERRLETAVNAQRWRKSKP